MTDWNHGFYTGTKFIHEWDPEDAQTTAHDELCVFADDASGGEWSDEVDNVSWGICLPLGVATEEFIDDEDAPEDAVDYHLREPEIDAAAFWEVVSRHAPKLAKALVAAVPTKS